MARPKEQAQPKVAIPDGVIQDEEQGNSVMDALQEERKRHPGPWVKMSPDEIMKHSLSGNLIGHDPKTGEVILKNPVLK